MHIRLIEVPYDIGRENTGPAKGPSRYLQAGAEHRLTDKGVTTTVKRIQLHETYQDQLHAITAVNQRIAQEVKAAVDADELPVILSGTCDASIGILAGFDHAHTGVIWFDAHGDFNTPETTVSGFFGGMPLAIITGHCYQDLWAQVGPYSTPVAESHTLMIGVRDLDEQERENLEHSAISVITVNDLLQAHQKKEVQSQLDELATNVRNVYLHFDIDILDPQEAPGVDYPATGGPALQEVEKALQIITSRFSIKAIALTAYNPERDQEEKTLQAGLRILTQLLESTPLSP